MSLEVLWEQDGLPAVPLPESLRAFYAGDLGLARECVYANFVETLDGVVAIPDVEQSNALVDLVEPLGVAVHVEAAHLCTQMRGVHEESSRTATTFWRGVYEQDADLRREFLDEVRSRR